MESGPQSYLIFADYDAADPIAPAVEAHFPDQDLEWRGNLAVMKMGFYVLVTNIVSTGDYEGALEAVRK